MAAITIIFDDLAGVGHIETARGWLVVVFTAEDVSPCILTDARPEKFFAFLIVAGDLLPMLCWRDLRVFIATTHVLIGEIESSFGG